MRRFIAYGPALIVLFTAVLILTAGPTAVRQLMHAQTSARVFQAAERLEHENILAQINQSYRDIATFVEPSVVHISAQRTIDDRPAGPISTGSGWIWDQGGHIVTNHHVVEDARRIDVQLYNGETREAEVVGYDRTTDIAVLRIAPGRLHPARRRPLEEPVRQGDLVFAFGSPFDFRFSMSSGVVSGMGRSVGIARNLGYGYENFIQVDAAINPGNSGGPLTDYRGHVIGMNTAIATGLRRPFDGRAPEEGQFGGVGLAIPIDMIEPAVSQIIEHGVVEKGFLGVGIADRNAPVMAVLAGLGLSDVSNIGVFVAQASSDLVEAADLRAGDVILQVGGKRVLTVEQTLAVSADAADDGDVDLRVWRYSHEHRTGVRRRLSVPAGLAADLSGVRLMRLDDPLSNLLSLQGLPGGGVPVTSVEVGGPAHDAGLRAGDVITHINGRAVLHVAHLRSVVSSMLPEAVARVRVWRFDWRTGAPETFDVDVRLARLDPLRVIMDPLPGGPHPEAIPRLGIRRMADMTADLAEQFGTPAEQGVLLLEVAPGSLLADYAVPGAVIIRVEGEAIEDISQLIEALGRTDFLHRDGVRIGLVKPDGSHTVARLRHGR